MKISELKECIPHVNFFDIDNYTFYTKEMELYNRDTEETIKISSIDELLKTKINNRTAREIIEEDDYKFLIDID